jgi:hypothetical protein
MADEGIRPLNDALPVLRFLQVRRAKVPRLAIDEGGMAGNLTELEPPALRPLLEGLLSLVARAAARLTAGHSGFELILDVEAPAACLEPGSVEGPMEWEEDGPVPEPAPPVGTPRRLRLTARHQPTPAEAGLGAFLKGVWYAPEGHLILADWLEDQLGPSPLATALRESGPLTTPRYGDLVAYDAFRWRWLGPGVLCYFSRRSTAEPNEPRRTVGFVLGLLHSAEAGALPRCWARQLGDGEAARRLAAEMGAELPQEDEPWAWV